MCVKFVKHGWWRGVVQKLKVVYDDGKEGKVDNDTEWSWSKPTDESVDPHF